MKEIKNGLDILVVGLVLLIGATGFSILAYYRIYFLMALGAVLVLNIIIIGKLKFNSTSIILSFVTGIFLVTILFGIEKLHGFQFIAYYATAILLSCSNHYGLNNFRVLTSCFRVIAWIEVFSIFLSVINYQLFTDVFWWFLSSDKASVLKRIEEEIAVYSYSGLAGEKAEAALIVGIGAGYEFAKIFTLKGNRRLAQYFVILMFISALFLTGKRTLSLGAVLCAVVIILIIGNNSVFVKRILTAFLILGIIFVAFATFSSSFGIFNRFADMLSGKENGRSPLWQQSWKMFTERPILGYGYGTYNSYVTLTGMTYYGANWGYYGHNGYLELLAETGVVGTVAFLWLLAHVGKHIVIYIRSIRSKMEILIGTVDFSYFIFMLYSVLLMLFYAITGNVFVYGNQLLIFLYFMLSIDRFSVGNTVAAFSGTSADTSGANSETFGCRV